MAFTCIEMVCVRVKLCTKQSSRCGVLHIGRYHSSTVVSSVCTGCIAASRVVNLAAGLYGHSCILMLIHIAIWGGVLVLMVSMG